MSKLTSLIRRAPKRFTAAVAVIAAAIIVPAAVFAWGPDRPTYTYEQPAPHVTFNSITNNPKVGDERNFVRIKEDSTSTTYTDNATLQPGKTYQVMVYYHNNAASNLNDSGKGIAKDVSLRMQMPATIAGSANGQVDGFINSSNATPTSVWDSAYMKNGSTGAVALRYVPGSATVTSNGAVNGAKLPDAFLTTGTNLGYDSLNGILPGCNQYAGYVVYKFTVVQPNFNVEKTVSVDNGKTWVDSAKTTPGASVIYKVAYTNTGSTQQDNVTLSDNLPKGVSYVKGSSLIANSQTNGYKSTSDGITTTGLNIGSYAPNGGNAFFKFSATMPKEDALECGINKLINTARATTSGGYKEDTAEVIIDRTCTPPKPVYACTSLTITRKSDTEYQFKTNYLVMNATFKKITYVIRDASGKEVARKDSTATTLNYTQTNPGKYSVQAIITVSVNGQDKTATSDKCKGQFEVPAKPTIKYTCDTLVIKRVSRTEFQFTTNYTVQNATFKKVTYVIRDANNKEVARKDSTAKTLNYTQTTVGVYSVQAIVTVSVNGVEKTATSDNCKGKFEVPATPEYCPIPGKEHLPKNSPDCKETPVTPPVTPPELPTTGMTENIVAIIGLGALIASIAYYVASRRALV